MKFWQLDAHCQWLHQQHLMELLADYPEWEHFAAWARNVGALAAAQDRSKLDAEVPDAAARTVLGESLVRYYLDVDVLRRFPLTGEEERLSAVEAYDRFGGDALAEADEKGSYRVAEC